MIAKRDRLIELTEEEIFKLVDARNRIVHGRQLPIDVLRHLAELVLRLLEGLPPPVEET